MRVGTEEGTARAHQACTNVVRQEEGQAGTDKRDDCVSARNARCASVSDPIDVHRSTMFGGNKRDAIEEIDVFDFTN
jgi:hypothetical protein